MSYLCAHRWAFPQWGAALQEMTDELAAPAGHEVTIRVTHCGMCHSDLHVQAGGFDMGGGKMSSLERAGTKLQCACLDLQVWRSGREVEAASTGLCVRGICGWGALCERSQPRPKRTVAADC